MSVQNKPVSRRDFLEATGVVAGAAALAACTPAAPGPGARLRRPPPPRRRADRDHRAGCARAHGDPRRRGPHAGADPGRQYFRQVRQPF